MLTHTDVTTALNDGQIVEEDTSEELMRLGGLYHDMWVQQPALSIGKCAGERGPGLSIDMSFT